MGSEGQFILKIKIDPKYLSSIRAEIFPLIDTAIIEFKALMRKSPMS